MSQLRVYRPDSAHNGGDDQPRILSFAFYAPLIRAERAVEVRFKKVLFGPGRWFLVQLLGKGLRRPSKRFLSILKIFKSSAKL